jgi:hypothetical protein
MVYVICCASRDEARAWAREHNVPRRQTLYAGTAAALDGLVNFAVVRLPSFLGRPDRERLEAVLRHNETKMAAGRAVARA